jgi:alcohol dehydrogenase
MSQSLMKAWRLERFGGALTLEDVLVPTVRAGTVLIRIEASPLLTYLKAYVDGKLTFYNPPPGKFTPGTNGVGVIDAVGQDVWHLKPGQRVAFSPHFVAGENVEDPVQILIGLTAFGAGSATMQADWRDGALAEFALAPVTTVTPADGLDLLDATRRAEPLYRSLRRPVTRSACRRRNFGRQRRYRRIRNRRGAARCCDGCRVHNCGWP